MQRLGLVAERRPPSHLLITPFGGESNRRARNRGGPSRDVPYRDPPATQGAYGCFKLALRLAHRLKLNEHRKRPRRGRGEELRQRFSAGPVALWQARRAAVGLRGLDRDGAPGADAVPASTRWALNRQDLPTFGPQVLEVRLQPIGPDVRHGVYPANHSDGVRHPWSRSCPPAPVAASSSETSSSLPTTARRAILSYGCTSGISRRSHRASGRERDVGHCASLRGSHES